MAKVLYCIISESREANLVWDSFKKNVLDVLNADIALCIATPEGYNYDNPYWQNAKYKWTTPEFEDWGKAIDEVQLQVYPQATDKWKQLMQVPDNWFAPVNGHRGAGAILIYYRWLLLRRLMMENIFEKYDRIIVSRSDYMWLCPHPPVELMDPKYVWVPDGEMHHGITDRYAILSRENVYAYLSILENIIVHPDKIAQHLGGWCNLERIVKINLDLMTGTQDNVRFFPFIMYSVRSEGTNTRWAPGIWHDDLGYYVKYDTEYRPAKHWATIYKTPEDWLKKGV
jgi:hypothetical protein